MISKCEDPIVVVGAGIAGLTAAKSLKELGYPVLVLEKSNALGGRLATRRIQLTTFDHGAQYFTARNPQFLKILAKWEEVQVVSKWFEKNGPEGGNEFTYIGCNGMTSIAKYLASGLEVHKNSKVGSVYRQATSWQVCLEDGKIIQASGLILTPPLPQTLEILQNSHINIPDEARDFVQQVQYEPCVTLLICLEQQVILEHPAGFYRSFSQKLIEWIADNKQKGISPTGFGLTVQLTPDASRELFELNDLDCFQLIYSEIKSLLKDVKVIDWQIKRWRYALVKNSGAQRFLWIEKLPPLILSGDAFAGPRVEAAALSGLSTAEQIIQYMET